MAEEPVESAGDEGGGRGGLEDREVEGPDEGKARLNAGAEEGWKPGLVVNFVEMNPGDERSHERGWKGRNGGSRLGLKNV